MKAKPLSQLKRCTEETARLLTSSRYSALKDKFSGAVVSKTSKNILGLHFEFPDSDRLLRGQGSHRRVSSTGVGRGQYLAQLVRILRVLRDISPLTTLDNGEIHTETEALELLETTVNAIVTHTKEKETNFDSLKNREYEIKQEMKKMEVEKGRLSGQEEELKQAKQDFDQCREQWERQHQEQLQALTLREAEIEQKATETQHSAAMLEKERLICASACAKMRKRLQEAEKQIKKLQTESTFSTRTCEMQSRLKNIVKQESLLNAVAEDLQYQRNTLLAKLENTLTEIAPQRDAEEEKEEVLGGTLRDCSNLMVTRELRSRSKASTQETTRLFRTLSRDRPVDITEIYSELEEMTPLDLTPKDVLTPKSLRSSRSTFES